MRILRYIMVGVLLTFGLTVANAQPCETIVPTEHLELFDSFCIQSCPDGFTNPIGFFIEGSLGSGIENFPILDFAEGCSILNTNCNVDCTPQVPPSGEWSPPGSDPFFPDYWTLSNDCYWFYLKWAHDNIWDFFFISFCEGCFCITFESELPVNLLDFSAVAGDGEVALSWNTASEANTDHFEITRDGEMVKTVRADNAVTGASYSWVDSGVENGRSYSYELYSVDVGGARVLLSSAEATPNFNTGTVTEYALHQNYPNPFNPETQIAFDLVESEFVTLKVMNLLGQEVATVVSGELNAGRHTVNFNGSDLTSGVYLYTLTTDNFSATRKLVLLK